MILLSDNACLEDANEIGSKLLRRHRAMLPAELPVDQIQLQCEPVEFSPEMIARGWDRRDKTMLRISEAKELNRVATAKYNLRPYFSLDRKNVDGGSAIGGAGDVAVRDNLERRDRAADPIQPRRYSVWIAHVSEHDEARIGNIVVRWIGSADVDLLIGDTGIEFQRVAVGPFVLNAAQRLVCRRNRIDQLRAGVGGADDVQAGRVGESGAQGAVDCVIEPNIHLARLPRYLLKIDHGVTRQYIILIRRVQEHKFAEWLL